MYKVYLNNIEQKEEDIINITELVSFSILREDGITSTEQILRETSEMELHFCGATYCYLVDLLSKDRCSNVDFHIEDSDTGLSYYGIIPISLLVLNPHSKTGTTKIKDTSFSAYVRDVMGVDVSLSNIKTLDCQPLTIAEKNIVFVKEHNATTTEVKITCYDVLDVFNYLLSYLTNNKVGAVSDFLTTNKYAITTGFNMHHYATTQDEFFPEVSIQQLFSELSKKERLYTSVDNDINGNPYLRIEQESYFFSNTTPLIDVDEIPFDTTQEVDIDRSYVSIKVGANKTMDGDGEYFRNRRYTSFVEESYDKCSNCVAKKENILDLVSNFIIDSNVIYDLLNAGASDNDNDEGIVLVNYEGDEAIRTLIGSEYVYNDRFRNENVLSRLNEDIAECISLYKYAKSGFRTDYTGYTITITGGFGYDGQHDRIEFSNIVYDNTSSLDVFTGTATYPPDVTNPLPSIGSVGVTYFETQQDGEYSFRLDLVRFLQISKPGFPTELDVQIQIVVHTNNTFTTYTDVYEKTVHVNNAVTTPTSITLITDKITLTAGQVVTACIAFKDYSGFIIAVGGNYDFQADNVIFEMVSDGTCETLSIDQDNKPFVLEFDYPLCQQDYQLIRDNKRGYITVKGQRFWIKELEYKPFALSHFVLMGNNSIA